MEISNETRNRLVKDLSDDELKQELASREGVFNESIHMSFFGDIRLKGRVSGDLEIHVPYIGPGFMSANVTEVIALRDAFNKFLNRK